MGQGEPSRAQTLPHVSFSHTAFGAMAEAEWGGATAPLSPVAVPLGTISSTTCASGGAGRARGFSTSCCYLWCSCGVPGC